MDAIAPDSQNTRLVMQYEALRRREYELITDLLEVVPRVNGLGEEQIAQLRDGLFHADTPYLIVFFGPFSSGKSSLLNALIGQADLLPVGPTPTTDRIVMLRYGDEAQRVTAGEVETVFAPSPLLRRVSFVDTPGLESIFQQHEQTTRRFLHRSDTVMLVMLATQAMTQKNVEYLQMLKTYGKHTIVLLSQVDLLQPDEIETVSRYVREQGRDQVGMTLDVWPVSAKLGMSARLPDGTLDAALWEASGLGRIERYIDEQLGDLARLRQKLQTPLQIAQNVHGAALNVVRGGQSALDSYQSIGSNLEGQLTAFRREQDRIAAAIAEEIGAHFDQLAARGSDAIRDSFALGRAPGLVVRGLAEMIGMGRLTSGAGGASFVRTAFESRKAFEPLREIPAAIDKLAPRLEGRDVQDIDDLVKYARREIEALPPNIRDKVIGTVQPPVQYDRTALASSRPALETIEGEARTVEMTRIESAVRGSLAALGVWEAAIVVFALLVLAFNPATLDQPSLTLVLLVFLIALALGGLLILPLRGGALANEYAERVRSLKARYLEALGKASEKQIEYGMRLRREAIAPLTRLIDAQTGLQTEQLNRLQAAQTRITQIEGEITAMGKPGFPGLNR